MMTAKSITELAVFVNGVLIGNIVHMDDGRWTPTTPPKPDGHGVGVIGVQTIEDAIDWLRANQ